MAYFDHWVKEELKVRYYYRYADDIVLLSDDTCLERFQHCAEIEKQRRMTNKELARWMREKPTREAKCTVDNYIYSVHTYEENCGDEEVDKNMVIREDDGEWREPLVEE